MKTIVIILAGGIGRRFLSDAPKQFSLINDKPILAYTIEKFNSLEEVDEILVVSHRSFVQNVRDIVEKYSFEKVLYVVEGGERRFDSVFAALKIYGESEESGVLVHDGVRPLISHNLIKKCISSLKEYPACVPLLQATNTLLKVENEKVVGYVEREGLYNAQTPQCFLLSVLREAYAKAFLDETKISFTDDCSVVSHYLPNVEIKMIEGEAENVKLTLNSDLKYIEFLMRKKGGAGGCLAQKKKIGI